MGNLGRFDKLGLKKLSSEAGKCFPRSFEPAVMLTFILNQLKYSYPFGSAKDRTCEHLVANVRSQAADKCFPRSSEFAVTLLLSPYPQNGYLVYSLREICEELA